MVAMEAPSTIADILGFWNLVGGDGGELKEGVFEGFVLCCVVFKVD
jgi:hypothetical protein